jgi:hypothetical protein
VSLINIDRALDFLSLDVQNRDRVEILAKWVQSRAESIIRRKLDLDTYTWILDGNRSQTIQLPVMPVTSVTAIYFDTDRIFDEAEDTDDYYVETETGIITFYDKYLYGLKTIKVIAVAGYDTDNFPSDLELAFYEAIQWNLSRLVDRAFGVRNQSTPDGQTVGYEMVLPMGVQRVFESYKDML